MLIIARLTSRASSKMTARRIARLSLSSTLLVDLEMRSESFLCRECLVIAFWIWTYRRMGSTEVVLQFGPCGEVCRNDCRRGGRGRGRVGGVQTGWLSTSIPITYTKKGQGAIIDG